MGEVALGEKAPGAVRSLDPRRLATVTSEEFNLLIGRRLRRRRRQMGMTQQALAEACGSSFKQIHKYETATNALTAARLWPIALALQIPITYFFEGLESLQAAE